MNTQLETRLFNTIENIGDYEIIYRSYLNNIFGIELQSKETLILYLKKMMPKIKQALQNSDYIFNLLPNKIKNDLNIMISNNKYIKMLEYFIKLVTPTKKEKNVRGEVFTPISLVNEMLDKLPENVWLNPHLKWLDPANGIGNFPVCVFLKLMGTLRDYNDKEGLDLRDEEIRRKHILENMIYVCELDKKNCLLYKILLGHDGKYNLNIHQGSSLELDIKNIWGFDKFDIIVGNPPYNKPKNSSLKGGYGGRSLWDKFVVKSVEEWLKQGGYLVFIHPPSWRKPEHYLWDILSQKQILYLNCISEKKSKIHFGCSTIVDYYVLENKNIYKNTEVYGQDEKTYNINLNEWDFIPSGCIYDIQKILGTNEVIYSRSLYGTDKKNVSRGKINEFKIQIIHNMTKKGYGYVYSNENKGQIGISKVILSFGRHQYPVNDWEGKLGMSQICYGLNISSKEEGDNIVNAINSDKFKNIIKYTKWSTFQTDWRMFKYFKPDFWKDFICDGEQ